MLKAVLLVAAVTVLQSTIHCCIMIVHVQIISSPHSCLPALLKRCLFRPMIHKQNKISASATTIFLATITVMVKKMFAPCRAILESASQLKLITNRFANFKIELRKESVMVI